MSAPKINGEKLQELLDQGVPPSQIAKDFGLSKSALSQRMRTERKTHTKLTLKRADMALLSGIETFAQLRKINDCANVVSHGRIEFDVFSEPLKANIKIRGNGEYLWGRQFACDCGKRSFRFPFLLRS